MKFWQTKKTNSQIVAESIDLLSEQVKDAWQQAKKVKLPPAYKKIDRIVVSGMGGSNLEGRIIASVFKHELRVPLLIEAGYEIPEFVNRNTLYISCSYSGNTEEPIFALTRAEKKGAKIFVITAGDKKNKLAELAKREKKPSLILTASKNPSNLPRLGLGYMIFSLASILVKTGVFKISENEIREAVIFLEKNSSKKSALDLAKKIFGKEAVLVGAEFLEGNLNVLRNQFCESAKNFASMLVVPDMNHFALEGLSNPASNKKNLNFVFFESDLYLARDKKRMSLTRSVLEKNKISFFRHELKGRTRLAQSLEMLDFGSRLTFNLASLNKVDPAKTPWVDWFKKKLG